MRRIVVIMHCITNDDDDDGDDGDDDSDDYDEDDDYDYDDADDDNDYDNDDNDSGTKDDAIMGIASSDKLRLRNYVSTSDTSIYYPCINHN